MSARQVVADAVPERYRLGQDSWSEAPLRLLALGHVLGEGISALSAPPPAAATATFAANASAPAASSSSAAAAAGPAAALTPAAKANSAGSTVRSLPVLPSALLPALSAMSIVYIACAAWDRSRRAAQFQLSPAARKYMGRRAGLESLAREWAAVISLPSLAAAGLLAGSRAALAASGVPAGGALMRWAPAALVCTLSPALLSAAGPVADAVVMDWAVRPALDVLMTPPSGDPVGPALVDELAPPTLSAGSAAAFGAAAIAAVPAVAESAANSAQPPDDVAALLGIADVDKNTRAQLAWAMDGRADTPFPKTSLPPAAAGKGDLK